jgi:hypothetical protein
MNSSTVLKASVGKKLMFISCLKFKNTKEKNLGPVWGIEMGFLDVTSDGSCQRKSVSIASSSENL